MKISSWLGSWLIAVQHVVSTTVSLRAEDVDLMADDPAIIRPSADTREYVSILLPNRLKVMLIRTPDMMLKMYDIAVSVSAGAAMHGREFPGLAHLLEHVVCLQNGLQHVTEIGRASCRERV